MSEKVGAASIRPYDDSPGYDLISLALVVLVVLLVGVWVTHFFHEAPPDADEYQKMIDRVGLQVSEHQLTAAEGELVLAKWVDFNFKPEYGDHIPLELRDHLKKALSLGADAPDPESLEWARAWYGQRANLLDTRDRQGFNAAAHEELAAFCRDVGLPAEAKKERSKILARRPDYPVFK